MKNKTQSGLIAAFVLLTGAGTVTAQVAIPASFAHPSSQVSASARGFKVRTVQANRDGGTLPNSIARAEAQLAGTLIDPATNKPFENIADPGPFTDGGYYDESGVIEYDAAGTMPGIPGPTSAGNTDNIAIEVLAYLDLAAGTYTMGVNSDDGFRVTVGPDARDQFSAIELGKYDGGRGAADSTFQFTVSQAGVYSFRLVYEQGNGGAVVSWFTGPSESKVLVNDPGDPSAIKAYRQLNVDSGPYISALSPSVGDTAALPNATVHGTIVDGATAQVSASSVKLTYDGAEVPAGAQKTGNKTTYSYDPPGLLAPLSKHQVSLIFSDSANNTRTNSYEFTVANFGNVTLPAPFFLETFDEVEEGSIPAGWTVTNYTATDVEGLDLDNPHSDSYKDWVVISKDRVSSIGAAGGWDAAHRLSVQPGLFVNGQEVTSLITNKFIYAESDVRGGSQVQYLFTKDIDCTGKTNVYVSYHSIYTQNQDNIDSVEYSIDSGATWLPILYMVDTADIVKDASGNIDAYATLSAPQGDTAVYSDPVTGEDKGGYYGAFIGVTSNLWSTLGPYISGRINDDSLESKRVELFPLPKADNQPKVRLRFAQAGTASWYFGVDDLGLYSIQQSLPPKITENPQSQVASAGSSVTLKVTATGDGLSYQWKLNGANLAGQTGATLTLSNVQAASAGDYTVVVTNSGGEATSSVATLQVFSGTIDQGLVVHLKFDNDLKDSSGKGNNGSPVGAPTFSAGKVGANAVHIPSGADYVTLGKPADLDFGITNDFSIAFWAKATEWNGDPSFVGNKDWNSGGNQGYVLATDGDGHFQWNLAGAPGSRKDYDGPPGLFTDHAWHHIAVTFQRSGNATTYVDGQVADSRPLTANQNDVSTPADFATNIGQDGTGSYGSAFTDADIDDLGIWRRVLTAQEVAGIISQGNAGKDLSTVVIGGGTGAGPTISGISISGKNVTITWTGAPNLKLQKAASLTSPTWQDVPGTLGSSTFSEAIGTANSFYRLVQQ